MAISNQDGLVSALAGVVPQNRAMWTKANVTSVAGRMCSLWTGTGQPGTGSLTLGQAAAGAVSTSADTGAYPFTNPSGQNTYAGRAIASSAATGMLVLFDLLWVWGSGGSGWVVTTTTAQATTSPAALTRPDANGNGTELWLEVLSTLGAGASTPSISYTNSGGTGSRTTSALASTSGFITGSMVQFPLQAGDTGVKSVQSMTLTTTMTSGTARVCILRRVAEIPITTANVPVLLDFAALGLPQIYDSASLFWAFLPVSTTSGPVSIKLDLIQG